MNGSPRTPVVIVGGGTAALTLALILDRHGVRSTVFAGDGGPDPATGFGQGPRTMEHYRRLGVAGAVRRLGLPGDHPADVAWFTRYTAPEFARLPLPSPVRALARAARAPSDDQLPEPGHPADDLRVASLLHEYARTRPCVTLRDTDRVLALRQDAAQVLVRTADAASGREDQWVTRYAVLAGRGPALARQLLGSVHERPRPAAPEPGPAPAVAARLRIPGFRDVLAANGPARSYRALGVGSGARMISLDGAHEWALLATPPGPVPSEAAQLTALVRHVTGRDLHVDVLGHRRIVPGSALVAQRFVKGRILLLGDSAHSRSPYTDSGTDTGVDDAANLAWKLAAVVRGWGGSRLPASYARERRPAALRAIAADRALGPGPAGARGQAGSAASAPDATEADLAEHLRRHARRGGALGLPLGVRYEDSPVIAAEPGAGSPGDSWGTYVPSGAPGGRAPHVWLEDWHGPGSSLHDRLGPGFTLLRLGPEPPDGKPLVAAAQAAGMPLTVLDVEAEAARDLYARDLSLVRPDLHIAWRGNQLPTDPDDLVAQVTGARRAAGEDEGRGTGDGS